MNDAASPHPPRGEPLIRVASDQDRPPYVTPRIAATSVDDQFESQPWTGSWEGVVSAPGPGSEAGSRVGPGPAPSEVGSQLGHQSIVTISQPQNLVVGHGTNVGLEGLTNGSIWTGSQSSLEGVESVITGQGTLYEPLEEGNAVIALPTRSNLV